MQYLGRANAGDGAMQNFISWKRLAEQLMRANEQNPLLYQIETFYLDETGDGLVYTVGKRNG